MSENVLVGTGMLVKIRSGADLLRVLNANSELRVTLCHGDKGSSAHLTDVRQSALREIRHEAVNVLLREGKLRPTYLLGMFKGWLYYATPAAARDDILMAQHRARVEDRHLMNNARVEFRALSSHLEIRLDTIPAGVSQLSNEERATLKELVERARKLTTDMEKRYAFQEKDIK